MNHVKKRATCAGIESARRCRRLPSVHTTDWAIDRRSHRSSVTEPAPRNQTESAPLSADKSRLMPEDKLLQALEPYWHPVGTVSRVIDYRSYQFAGEQTNAAARAAGAPGRSVWNPQGGSEEPRSVRP